jgi:hypothetical protein
MAGWLAGWLADLAELAQPQLDSAQQRRRRLRRRAHTVACTVVGGCQLTAVARWAQQQHQSQLSGACQLSTACQLSGACQRVGESARAPPAQM